MRGLINKIVEICLVLFIVMLAGCNLIKPSDSKQVAPKLPENKPSDFNFVVDYGVSAGNELDTIKGIYIKDMIGAPSVTANLKLSEADMNEIYSKMKDIDILSYPEKFYPKGNVLCTPYDTYSIKILYNGKTKNIHWDDGNLSDSKDAVQLRNLFKRIDQIVSKKEEYKKLPEPKGGYN